MDPYQYEGQRSPQTRTEIQTNPPEFPLPQNPGVPVGETVLVALASLVLGHFAKPFFAILIDNFKRDSGAGERFQEYLEKQLADHQVEREQYFKGILDLQLQAKDDREACAREREQFLRHLEECQTLMEGFKAAIEKLSSEIQCVRSTQNYEIMRANGETDISRPPGNQSTPDPNKSTNSRIKPSDPRANFDRESGGFGN